MKRSSIKWIFLLLIIVAAGFLLTVNITDMFTGGNRLFENGIVRSETAITLIVLMLAVPLLLIILLLILAFGRTEPQTIKATIDGVVTANSASADPAPKSEEAEEETGERFCMLSEIERNKSKYERSDYEKNVTLEEFCDNFRNYAANRLKLYYDISDIRRFIAGMAVSHIIILQGMSGTGKTSLAHAFGSFIDNISTIIPVLSFHMG